MHPQGRGGETLNFAQTACAQLQYRPVRDQVMSDPIRLFRLALIQT
jgi:hypothetical protein